MFEIIDRVKPGLQKLVAALRETYPYASVLAVADDARSWSTSRGGISISSPRMFGGTGYVVRVFDGEGCAEYSFNEFSEEKIPAIRETLARRLAEQTEALEGFAPLPTPLPADDPAVLKKESPYRVHPRELGDEAIVKKLNALRERALGMDERVLDVQAAVSYRSFRKLFLSEHRDLDQTLMWTTASLIAMASRGQEIKDAYLPCSALGGAEVLDEMDAGVEKVVRDALELLDSRPIVPGEYECVCDPETTGMIVHEAFGHGVEMDYERKAYTRMTNTYFQGGDATPEEMIASVKDGFLLESPSSGMEDPKNWGIQCMVTTAKEIKDGRLTGRLFSPIVLTGYVPDLLKSVTMMSKTAELSGSGFCGKGYKEWVKVSDGGPYMKARIRLG